MTKEEFIANKMKILVGKEGYDKSQAYAIALSYWNKENKPKAQFGFGNPQMAQYRGAFGTQGIPYSDASMFTNTAPTIQTAQYRGAFGASGIPYTDPSMFTDTTQVESTSTQNTQEINKTVIDNPFGGVSLDNALNYAGRGFGEKDPWKAGIGTSLSLLKGSRNFLSGYGAGKVNREGYEDYIKNLYKDMTPNQAFQSGGKFKNSEVLAMNALTDNPQGNVNAEGGEFVKRTNGMVQPIVGENHVKNGKKADGVDVKLNDGDKVLSDYIKLRPNDIKELKERYKIALKKGDTPAKALAKIETKIGLKKETEKLADSAEKLEKALKIKDPTSKELSIETLQNIIATQNEKIANLKQVSAEAFDELFEMQEEQPKKDTSKLYDKNGKEVEDEEDDDNMQMGGVYKLANKFGISKERAKELVSMQMGGEQQGGQEEQIMQMVMQMLQEGATPEQIVQTLLEQGVPQEQAVQAVQMMMQQSPQEEGIEGQMSNPKEEQIEMAQQGGGFSFSTRVLPTLKDYTTEGTSILNQDTLSNVEEMQPYTGKGYGAKMANVEDTIKVHNWYFDTEEKKDAFRKAVLRKGEQPEVKAFQEAYNKELENRAKKAGLPENEINSIKEQVGFSDSGVRKLDGLFGAFTSTRPLYNFAKKDGKVEVIPTAETVQLEEKIQPQELEVQNRIKNAMAFLPTDLRLPPSGVPPLLKSEVNLGRIEPIKMTPEPMLAEQARQQYTAQEQLSATGLPPQIQQALLSQNLASGQMASNDAISKVEQFNNQQRFQADQFNIGQRAKEDITNEQFAQDYQSKMLASISNTERDYRNYLIEGNLQNRANWKDIENANLLNANVENFSYTPGVGVDYINNRAGDLSKGLPSPTAEQLANWTPEELQDYMRKSDALRKKKLAQNQQ